MYYKIRGAVFNYLGVSRYEEYYTEKKYTFKTSKTT